MKRAPVRPAQRFTRLVDRGSARSPNVAPRGSQEHRQGGGGYFDPETFFPWDRSLPFAHFLMLFLLGPKHE
jgi:hypothetical protein